MMRMARMMVKAYIHLLDKGDDGCSVMDSILLLQLGREYAVYKSLLRIIYPRNGYFEYEFSFHNAYQKL